MAENLPANVYPVDATFYAIDSMFEILSGFARVYFSYKGIKGMNDRITMTNRCTDSTLYVFDVITLVLYSFGSASVLYKIIWGIFNSVQYFFITAGPQNLIIYEIGTVYDDPVLKASNNAVLEYINYTWNWFFSPGKTTLIFDAVFIYGFTIAQEWGPLTFISTMWLVKFSLEWIVFPILPALDVPPVPFPTWFGGPSNVATTMSASDPMY